MQANPDFRRQDKSFWAHVRTLSQILGYAPKGLVLAHNLDAIEQGLTSAGLTSHHLWNDRSTPSTLAQNLVAYFDYRATLLNTYIEPRLINAERAATVFHDLHQRIQPRRPSPLNKQTGEKKQIAYLTGLVNMLIEVNLGDLPCDYDPRQLTTITRQGQPLRTLARRMDGCFPGVLNPIAIWEIQEYYYTTTFGSRIADGVYETLLDGLELEELAHNEGIHVEHLLVIDAYHTWWTMGKSYLCRIVDMLNMGYVDEVLVGYEVIERLPDIVERWKVRYRGQQ
jgi:hypothetical protein